jgi:hypothetical protein
MKTIVALIAVAFAIGWAVTGCQTAPAKLPVSRTPDQSTRNNCYSLLHQLLEEQKDVSMLRFIKREDSDVKELVKKIASTSADESKLLEQFAKQDHSLNLDATLLPSGESATRDAIASTKKHELLGKTGDEFELALLLTQTEALNYAWHLAQVAAENDLQPDRARAMAGVSAKMRDLYEEVFLLLLSRTKATA